MRDDADVFAFLDAQRHALTADILRHTEPSIWADGRLHDTVQSILLRQVFLRICQDRSVEIDVDALPQIRDIFGDDKALAHFADAMNTDGSRPYFHQLPAEMLGRVYERLLDTTIHLDNHGTVSEEKSKSRKAGGVFYTPQAIVDFIVEETLGGALAEILAVESFATFEQRTRGLRILDPSCGAGVFLLRAFARMCEHWKTRFTRQPEECKPHHGSVDSSTGNVALSIEWKSRILRDNIYGVDMDAHAVDVARLSLVLKMLDGGQEVKLRALPPLEHNIQCGNALVAYDFSEDTAERNRVNVFDWHAAFPEIMKTGGFDAVVGNPPWGAEMDNAQWDYLRRKHASIVVRMVDSYMYFVQASLGLLRSDGRMGFILPDAILYQRDTEKLRRRLATETRLECVVNVGDVFEQVVRPACIVVCAKNQPENPNVVIADLASADEGTKLARLVDRQGFGTVDQAMLRSTPRCLLVTRDVHKFALWHRIQSIDHVPLAEMVDDDGIQRGVSPDLKDAFLVDTPTVEQWALEATHLRPTLTGGIHVKRYHIDRPDLRVIYTTRNDDVSKLPNICQYIDSFKKRITCSEVKQSKHSLYALHRARDERIFDKTQKLVGVITEDEIVLALDDRRSYPTDGIYLFAPKASVDIRYLLGILNSRLFVFLYRLLSMEEGRVLAQVKPTLLAQLPIRRIDSKNPVDKRLLDTLVAHVDNVLGFASKLYLEHRASERQALEMAIRATDNRIDECVYDLYALTDHERKLIEQAWPRTQASAPSNAA